MSHTLLRHTAGWSCQKQREWSAPQHPAGPEFLYFMYKLDLCSSCIQGKNIYTKEWALATYHSIG